MGDYHDLYLKTDVLLLRDVFEAFIDMCMRYYGLDPCHYFSGLGLSWDAMLKMTGVVLEHISDIDMYLFIEKGMIGGISYIGKRYAKANNKYVEGYDATADDSYIMHFDANNLYGWSMNQYLSYGGFKWMSKSEIGKFKLNPVSATSDEGYILEEDLEYPDEFHHLHNDYALAPQKIKVTDDMLSRYCSNMAKKYDVKLSDVKKVIPIFWAREKYIVHYKNFQLYTSLDIKVLKVHRILKFKQSCWMKKCIDFNTQKRMAAVNKFEKDFFKLMNNSAFGKTMENLRNRIDVKLLNNAEKYLKWVSRPNFVSQKIFDETFVAIHMKKVTLTLIKPIYVGFIVLELSKTLMYDWHYNYFKKKFDCNLLFTDADSLMYEIKSNEDVYEKLYADKDLFDFSDYSRDSNFFDASNKKVTGKMKDEMRDKVIFEFVGLKSKMYSILTVDDEEKMRAKGVNIKLRHAEYKKTLFDGLIMRHNMKRIQSKKHELGTYDVCKISLSCFDDKRYRLDDGITGLSYFHKDIRDE